MEVHPNAITNLLLEKIVLDINISLEESNWRLSQNNWPQNIIEHHVGTCSATTPSEQITKELLGEMGHLLPDTEEVWFSYHHWHKLSGIAKHNDGNHRWGATLYLNKHWDINWGGTFLWEESEDDWRALNPTSRTLVINTKQQLHMVTPVSPFAPMDRFTIQMFGKKKPIDQFMENIENEFSGQGKSEESN